MRRLPDKARHVRALLPTLFITCQSGSLQRAPALQRAQGATKLLKHL